MPSLPEGVKWLDETARKPNDEDYKVFEQIEAELKKRLVKRLDDLMKHEPAFTAPVNELTNEQLKNFSTDDLKQVRYATPLIPTEPAKELFGKVFLPNSGAGFFHFRAHVPNHGKPTVHSIHVDTKERASIFYEADELDYFHT